MEEIQNQVQDQPEVSIILLILFSFPSERLARDGFAEPLKRG